ncbi:hypothetical protein [Nonlabens marinus]|uniref:Uncharacterized protein n=1 Tax=Nonlabens marinus S1-08 TaxID=1454201 RepID=W8VNZ7_9FLAO|nr:hypothetical protein [Nonlabens marinus]BAO54734.1 hypothetical protein NMS_0725 [Nonlabens marinus S1-08]
MTSKIMTVVFLVAFSLQSFSQSDDDYRELIDLAITSFGKDSTLIFKRFDNKTILQDLNLLIGEKHISVVKKYRKNLDSIDTDAYWKITSAAMFGDTVTVAFQKLNFYSEVNIQQLNKTQNKRIERYTDKNLKRNRKLPIARISYPIITSDEKKAIVYFSNVCGSLCASGGFIQFKKVFGVWEFVKREVVWIS